MPHVVTTICPFSGDKSTVELLRGARGKISIIHLLLRANQTPSSQILFKRAN